MYPVVLDGWLRLRVALVSFLAGTLLTMPVSTLSSTGYSIVPVALTYGGFGYMLYSSEWSRVLWEKRARPRTSKTLVRIGTLAFFMPLAISILHLIFLRAFGVRLIPLIPVEASTALYDSGAVVASFGFFLEWRNLPRKIEVDARKAFGMMEKAGCGIGENFWVVLEPSFPSNVSYSAYHYRSEGASVIKVSAWAVHIVAFFRLDELMVHEMSHAYRSENAHPSHNNKIIDEVVGRIINQGSGEKYQQEIIRDLVVHLKEVYADDVAFRVLRASNAFRLPEAAEWYQKSIVSKTSKSRNPGRKKWENSAKIIANSFTISQMTRHGIPDIGNRAKAANERILSALPTGYSKAFDYFSGLFTELKENLTEDEFKIVLENYLTKFLEIVGERT